MAVAKPFGHFVARATFRVLRPAAAPDCQGSRCHRCRGTYAATRATYSSAPFDGFLDHELQGWPIQIAEVPGAGHGLLAARDIHYGETVLSAKPVLAYPSADRLHKVCYLCLKHLPPGGGVSRGGHCFCNHNCAETAWESFLEVEAATDMAPLRHHCDSTGERFPLLAARLACQVLTTEASLSLASSSPSSSLEDEPPEAAPFFPGSEDGREFWMQQPDAWLSPLCYLSKVAERPPEAWQDAWFVMADALRHVRLPGLSQNRLRVLLSQRISMVWFSGVLARLHTNVFKVTYPAPTSPDGHVSFRDMDPAQLLQMMDGQSGTAAYGLASMFNHACEPNVDVNFPMQDSTAVFTAARDIEAGEELFISYIDASQSREQRQQFLRWAYGFTCQCPLCQDQQEESPAEPGTNAPRTCGMHHDHEERPVE